ncbi:hypothetical protein Glove_169g45 [Diversispora epigaea]|uniref:Uncharacterized protein n=1 Tax=Diversispora epigaea TaxID=1348612 RepID=A0A397IVR0_9GLOM|nr:hypothetical protein Glove_169g45 [Diversispora epigaea]
MPRITKQINLGELIQDDNIIVLIENIWIEKNIDLSNRTILDDIIDKLDIEENEYSNTDDEIDNNKGFSSQKNGILAYKFC